MFIFKSKKKTEEILKASKIDISNSFSGYKYVTYGQIHIILMPKKSVSMCLYKIDDSQNTKFVLCNGKVHGQNSKKFFC